MDPGRVCISFLHRTALFLHALRAAVAYNARYLTHASLMHAPRPGSAILCLFGLFLLGSQPCLALSFLTHELSLEHDIQTAPLTVSFSDGTRSLLILGADDQGERRYTIVDVDREGHDPKIAHSGTPPASAVLIDTGTVSRDGAAIFFLDHEGVHAMAVQNAATPIAPLDVSSIYRMSGSPRWLASDFIRDLNGDELGDLLITDFAGTWLAMRQPERWSAPQLLPVPAEMRIGASGASSYREFPQFLLDTNADGRDDLVFHRGQQLLIFAGDGERFATPPKLIELPASIRGNRWQDDLAAERRAADQRAFEDRRLDRVEDFNGDGIADLLAVFEAADGLFERELRYELYLGVINEPELSFPAEATTSITQAGIPLELRVVDFEGDGRKELVVASVEISVRKIISGLLTGSINAKLDVYRMENDRNFRSTPSYERKLPIAFDLGSGTSNTPVVEFADFDGDGIMDLLANRKKDRITVFRGQKTNPIFGSTLGELEIKLPSDGSMVSAEDLNGDGLSDIVIRFHPAGSDGEEKRRRLTIAFAEKG